MSLIIVGTVQTVCATFSHHERLALPGRYNLVKSLGIRHGEKGSDT